MPDSLIDQLRDEGEALFHAYAENGLVHIMWHNDDGTPVATDGMKSAAARRIAANLPDEASGFAERLRSIADVADQQAVDAYMESELDAMSRSR
jgi:hypothetical protein